MTALEACCRNWGIALTGCRQCLQALCAAVQHHLDLISKLQQQMWSCLGNTAQATSANILVGLQPSYLRAMGAIFTLAAPISMNGQSCQMQHCSSASVHLYCNCCGHTSGCRS